MSEKESKPKVYIWHDDSADWGSDQLWRAIREDGEDVGSHVSSNRMFGVQDIKKGLDEDALEIMVLGPSEWPPDEVLERGGWERTPEPEPEPQGEAEPTLMGEGEEIWLPGEVGPDGQTMHVLFDTDNPIFARGWEAGKFYFQAAVRPTAFIAQVHPSNIEMVKRICGATNRNVAIEHVSSLIVECRVDALPERPAGRMPIPMPEPPTAPPEL